MITNIFNKISSIDLEILEFSSHQSRPRNCVSQEVNIHEPIQRPINDVIFVNNNANNVDEDYSHIETFELED